MRLLWFVDTLTSKESAVKKNLLFVVNYGKFCFSGGRDRRGGPIITFPARSRAAEIEPCSLARVLTYLASLPRWVIFQWYLDNFYFHSLFCLVCCWRDSRWMFKKNNRCNQRIVFVVFTTFADRSIVDFRRKTRQLILRVSLKSIRVDYNDER